MSVQCDTFIEQANLFDIKIFATVTMNSNAHNTYKLYNTYLLIIPTNSTTLTPVALRGNRVLPSIFPYC
jgi:hypothetical protein